MKRIKPTLAAACLLLAGLYAAGLWVSRAEGQCISCTYREAARSSREAANKARQAGCGAAASCYETYARYYDCLAAQLGPNGPSSCSEPSCDTSCAAAGGGGGGGGSTSGNNSAGPGESSSGPAVNADAIRNARVIDNTANNSANHGPAEVKDMSGGDEDALRDTLQRPVAIDPGKDMRDRARRYGGDIRDAGALGLLFDDKKSHELFQKLFQKLGIDWDSVNVSPRKPKPDGKADLGPGGGSPDGVQCGRMLCHTVIDFNKGTEEKFYCDPCNPPKVIEFPGRQPAPARPEFQAGWCGLARCPDVPHDPKFFSNLESQFKAIAQTYPQEQIARGQLEPLRQKMRDYADSYIAAVNRRFRDFIENQTGDSPPPTQLMIHWDVLRQQYERLLNTLDRPVGKP